MNVQELMRMMEEAENGDKRGGIRNQVLNGLKREDMSLNDMRSAGFSRSIKSLSSYMSYLKKGDNMAHTYTISGGGEGSDVKRKLIGRKHKKSGKVEVWFNGAWVEAKELAKKVIEKDVTERVEKDVTKRVEKDVTKRVEKGVTK